MIVSVLGFGLSLSTAKAQNVTTIGAPETPVVVSDTPAPVVIDVDANGQAVIRGVVTSVDVNSMTITSWGGEWTIRTTSEAGVIPSANNVENTGDLSAISVGDLIGAEGTLATDAELTLDAVFVRNWTTDPYPGVFETTETTDEVTNVEADTSVEPMDNGTEPVVDEITYSGEVDSVTESSFTFTDDFDSTYTVYSDTDAPLFNDNGEIINFSEIEEGDEVEIEGTASGNVLTPSIMRLE